jgi:hypothetical protein
MNALYHPDRRVRQVLRNVLRTSRKEFRDHRWLVAELNRLIIERHQDLFALDEVMASRTAGVEIVTREFDTRYTLDVIIHGPQPSEEDEAEIRRAVADSIAEEIQSQRDALLATGCSIRPIAPILISLITSETEFELRTLSFKTVFGIAQAGQALPR